MRFMVSANTDVGIKKSTNQDSLSVKVIQTSQGQMVFGIICDGMGGLAKGELASATVIRAFEKWILEQLPILCCSPIEDFVLRSQWTELIAKENRKIMQYGRQQGIQLGTTITAMLITQQRYYIVHVGDSRAYEITENEILQITKDQTFVEREIELGRMTREEAKKDIRRNVLLQCCGASQEVYPEMFFGTVHQDAVYMLCSDGFRHELSLEEIQMGFQPSKLLNFETMQRNTIELIEWNKQRQEQDNISVVLIRTF